MRKLKILLALFAGLLYMPLPSLAAESDLGISLQILKGGEGSSENINKNNNLWFVIEPGKSSNRQVRINSASNITQKIHLSIAGRSQIDGELKYDANVQSVVDDWAQYSANDFLLKPGDTRQVTISIAVPVDATREVLQPALLVKAMGATTENSRYKIPTAMQISQGIFLGVGTTDEFRTSFEIDDVFGQNGDSGHSLQIRISNSGKTPIALEGEIQLSSSTFVGSTIGPLSFYTPTIYPGESGFGEVLVGPEVPEDKYRIQVRATQGFITETRNFEKDIDFRGLAQLYSTIFWGAVILISLVIALASIRYLRKSQRGVEISEEATKSSTTPSNGPLLPEKKETSGKKEKNRKISLAVLLIRQAVTLPRKTIRFIINLWEVAKRDSFDGDSKKSHLQPNETFKVEFIQKDGLVTGKTIDIEPKGTKLTSDSIPNSRMNLRLTTDSGKFAASNVSRDASTQELLDEVMAKWKRK